MAADKQQNSSPTSSPAASSFPFSSFPFAFDGAGIIYGHFLYNFLEFMQLILNVPVCFLTNEKIFYYLDNMIIQENKQFTKVVKLIATILPFTYIPRSKLVPFSLIPCSFQLHRHQSFMRHPFQAHYGKDFKSQFFKILNKTRSFLCVTHKKWHM